MNAVASPDFTQLAGVLGFTLAALACARAAWRRPREALCWAVLAGLNGALALEVALGFRHRLHGAVDALLQQHGWYLWRGPWQVALVTGVLALLAIACVFTWRLGRSAPRPAVASGATIVALALFAVETISLHRIDAMMYEPVGPVMALAWAWLASGLTVTVAAAFAGSRRGTGGGARTISAVSR